jgi:hypothetical protein
MAAILSILFAVPLFLARFPETAIDIGVVAGISVASALLASHVILPLASRLPNSVSVMTDSFVVGRQRLWFIEIEHAVVGSAVLGKRAFPVLSFRTKGGQNYLFGLSHKVEAQELADFLVRVGVREPHGGLSAPNALPGSR